VSLSILIIDPDKKWSSVLKTYLDEKLFSSECAINGREAQLLIYKNTYQIVILDIETTNHTSFEVLRYLKLNSPEIKVIMTMKNSASLSGIDITASDIKKMGASDVLTKTLGPEAIYKCIEGDYKIESWKDIKSTTEVKDPVEVKMNDDEFTRIKFENFLSGNTTIFDHYIRLSKDKYVKILYQGESFDSKRLKKYEDTDLKHLYFKTSDRASYINYTNQLLKKIIGSNIGTVDKKMAYTHNVVEKYLEQVFNSGLKPQLIQEGKTICENMYNLIQKEPSLLTIMKSYEDYDQPAYSHLFLVSFFSVVTCKNLEWSSARTVEYVALGGLLHDLGKLKLPISLREKDPTTMTKAERELYETHPFLGAELLSKYPTIPEPVRQIAYQHHELANGEGFPNKLNNLKIYPPAKIVSLANDYVEFLFRHKVTPLEGIKMFLKDRSALTKYDPLILKALISGFIKDK
jgi:putative nucleotidyltransferase with HDIG domain